MTSPIDCRAGGHSPGMIVLSRGKSELSRMMPLFWKQEQNIGMICKRTNVVNVEQMVIGGKEQSGIVHPIPAGGGSIWPPPVVFFYITQKVLVWGCWNFLTFLTYPKPSL